MFVGPDEDSKNQSRGAFLSECTSLCVLAKLTGFAGGYRKVESLPFALLALPMPAFRLLPVVLCVLLWNTPAMAQFKLLGDATPMNADCIRLTPDTQYRRGIAYHATKLNLNTFFEIEFDIFLGERDEGADGIVFTIHNDPRAFNAYGTWGECMSYGRWNRDYMAGDFIAPSIAVEFDTYPNFRQNDPDSGCDHVAYLENGTNFHTRYWSNGREDYNLEDGRMHNFRFSWDPQSQTIRVRLDNQLVYEGQRDLINDIFNGETQVIWGFTASTGRAHNLQYFCLRSFARR